MLRLMLLRHAKSSWSSPGTQDAARPLSGRGEAAAHLMGGYMARHSLVPERVLCSAACRTRETWAAIAAQWPADMDVVFDQRLYEATPQTVLSIVRDQDDAARTPLLNVLPITPAMLAKYVPSDFDAQQRESAEEALTIIAKESGLNAGQISATVRQGGIYHEVLEEAKSIHADLIVVSSHLPGMKSYFLGSNACHVVRSATCSVLVVRHTR